MDEDNGTRSLRRLERTDSVSVAVAGELLTYLLSGALEAGARLPSERELTELLGVGRSAVREALKPLALLGIVEVRQCSGTYFRGTESELLPRVIEWSLLLGDRTIAELMEARSTVEGALARLAALHRDSDQLNRLARALSTMSRLQPRTFTDADAEFHLCIAEASQNRVLAGVLTSIRGLLRAWIKTVVHDQANLGELFRLHEEVYAAIQRQDPVAAEAAMQIHMEWVTERLESAVAAHHAARPNKQ